MYFLLLTQLEAPEWKLISSNAKDLVLKMLAPNSHNRLTIEEVLNHPWMRVSTILLTHYSFVQKYKFLINFRINYLFVVYFYYE